MNYSLTYAESFRKISVEIFLNMLPPTDRYSSISALSTIQAPHKTSITITRYSAGHIRPPSPYSTGQLRTLETNRLPSPCPRPKPFLKWAGGKTQLLSELTKHIPKHFGRYIEPFVGGGALFFGINPQQAIISDSNPELINVYQCVADDVDRVIAHLLSFQNEEQEYYRIRALDHPSLNRFFAAARTIYLNRTCYNGLYRVNRNGQFNVPFGRYKSPRICPTEVLKAASRTLQNTQIVCADYKTVLKEHAQPEDFVFLDPPYLPVSKYADFKRYTKEQFYIDDHHELAKEVRRLHQIGCHVILTNSNHPLVHELYDQFELEVVNTRRNISSKALTRNGEDVIVTAPSPRQYVLRKAPLPVPLQAKKYPSTRFMGSKEKLLPYIQDVASRFEYDSVLDLFSGSGVVGYLFKSLGKQVVANDYMAMSATFTKALVENNAQTLDPSEIQSLFVPHPKADSFVQETFAGLYFTEEDNRLIDTVRANIKEIACPYKRAIALSALIRACMKKRARGIFTYTGHRYDDGRSDLRRSLQEHVIAAAQLINQAVFDNKQENKARRGDAMTLRSKADLIYIDPPYYSPLSDNEYVRRYHFVEGLACDWKDVDMQWHTKTKKFKSYPTPFSSRLGSLDAFDKLFRKLKDSILVVSYSSNSEPTREEMISLMAKYKQHVEVVHIDYRYSFATQGHKINDNKNQVQEYLFIGF